MLKNINVRFFVTTYDDGGWNLDVEYDEWKEWNTEEDEEDA